jgi:cellulose synthase/poly-beta-1,6-N-acetylglucosamine synthase-like glycosyltransferase
VNVRLLHGALQGLGVARYNGLVVANGMYMLFFDADNVLKEDFMSKVIPLLTKDSSVSLHSKGYLNWVSKK